MTTLQGLSPLVETIPASGRCDLYEFLTRLGKVVLHEVDCMRITYEPTQSTIAIHFSWDGSSPLRPSSPELENFTLEFNGAAIFRWAAKSDEPTTTFVGQGEVRSFVWNIDTQTFELGLAEEELAFFATQCMFRPR